MSVNFPFPIPTITPEDLASFDEKHFSQTHHAHFTTQFLPPPPPPLPTHEPTPVLEDDDDDDLGYYHDGTKRTLTDEQISMFRFSEVQELLRRKHHNQTRRKKHRDRIAAKKASGAEANIAETRNLTPSENKGVHQGAMCEEMRRGRLEAAIWASELPWDEEGEKGDVPSLPQQQPQVVGKVDWASGKEFLWPAIRR